MLEKLKDINWKKVGTFAGGVLFGTAGVKVLSSKDAKKLFTNCTAAVLRAKTSVMKTATCIQENACDVYEEAKQINADREAKAAAAEFEDADSFEEVPAEETKAEDTNESEAE